MIEIEKNNKKEVPKKGTIIATCVVVLLVFVIFMSIFAAQGEKSDNGTDGSPQIIEMAVGETFEFESIEFTIESYEFRYYANQGDFPAGKGNVWLMVNAKLENPNTERKKYDKIINNLYYITEKGEAKYTSSYYKYSEWIMASNYLEPFEIIHGYYMFLLPENVAPAPDSSTYQHGGKSKTTKDKNFEIRFQLNQQNPNKIIKIKL